MEKSDKKQNDSLNLYLYRSLNYTDDYKDIPPYEIKESVFCLINSYNKRIYFRDNQTEIEDIFKILFKARKSKYNYYELIYPIIKLNFNDNNEIEKLDKRMWYVFNREKQNKNEKDEGNQGGEKNEEYNLIKNDIIKFGNAKYEIIEKHISSPIPEIKNQLNEIIIINSAQFFINFIQNMNLSKKIFVADVMDEVHLKKIPR